MAKMMFDLQSFPLMANIAIFATGAVIIWFAGSRIARYADQISRQTGLGSAFVGLLLLALATEMPEVATTITAAITGNAPLAVNNLFGGVVTQTMMLAVADVFLARNALTFFTPNPALMLQGEMLIFLLGLAASLMLIGEYLVFMQVGLWPLVLLLFYISTLYLVHRYEKHGQNWQATNVPDFVIDAGNENQREGTTGPQNSQDAVDETPSLQKTILRFAGVSLIILVAGFFLVRAADALAVQTGLGANFIGASLLAVSTSLPELSTTIAAVRLGNHGLAVSNIFGSNAIMIALLFFTDLFYREGPIFNTFQASALFAALMGIVVTAVYLVGLTERLNRTVLRMGIDSFAVLILYLLSLVGLYLLR